MYENVLDLDEEFKNLLENIPPSSIIKLDGRYCSYNDFFHNFIKSNRPCIVYNVGCDWECTKLWTKNNQIDFEFIKEKYGTVIAPVADCNKKFYNAQEKCDMSMADFINYWMIKNEKLTQQSLYLKDWHFVKNDPDIYEVPAYFASDWLNEYYTKNDHLCDDYKFIYMGPKNTWTPLHEDVFSSFSWSVNVFGRKRWILLPPGREEKYKDKNGHLIYDLGDCDLSQELEVLQESSEAIFVPSGWYHQVWNLEDTISVNHNWINGCNIELMWKSLVKNLELVKIEIKDCKEMEGWDNQCEIILKASYGINFTEFYDFLLCISEPRINSIMNSEYFLLGNFKFGKRHVLFDLEQIYLVLKQFVKHSHVLLLDNVYEGKLCAEEIIERLRMCLRIK